ncbi:hypothetical protein B0H34DRAFT_719215 [Crassisporium funariophilum]|nr:hypothetical protein B0H34DRAFT_719215 [Crassisporium funariophilum]
MTTTLEVTLVPPTDVNLDDLAQATLLAFELLAPWCRLHYASLALQSISEQALQYVKAIDFSVVAAQQGFMIADEAISFAELLPHSSPKDHHEYLLGMLAIADRGQQSAKLTVEKFRDVRTTVLKLLQDAAEEQSGTAFKAQGGNTLDNEQLTKLEEGISVLEKFSTCISSYISWWNLMALSGKTQFDRTEHVVFHYDCLREKTIISKWRDLRRDYVTYTNKIRALQDSNPSLFSVSKPSKSDKQITHRECDNFEIPETTSSNRRQVVRKSSLPNSLNRNSFSSSFSSLGQSFEDNGYPPHFHYSIPLVTRLSTFFNLGRQMRRASEDLKYRKAARGKRIDSVGKELRHHTPSWLQLDSWSHRH